jgi:YidC/Oxa1 family membrane protein insertase
VERRHIQFIAISLAIILAGQLLQAWLFPQPPKAPRAGEGAPPPAEQLAAEPPIAGSPEAEAAGSPAAETAAGSLAAETAAGTLAAETAAGSAAVADVDERPSAARQRLTLGSLDVADPARMLVTFTSHGAAVERIELADPRFLDQDDRSGYLGHLAASTVPEGCRVGVVGPGTPAAAAGLAADDVITAVDGLAVADPATLQRLLAATKPGQQIELATTRDGRSRTATVTLGRRPLEVVRPEYRAAPVVDPDRQPHDPLSFRLTLESRDGRGRRDPAAELAGHRLGDVDWEAEALPDGGVRFVRSLPRGLTVKKTYRLGPGPQADAAPDSPTGYRLDLEVELAQADGATVVVYALDGPTGLPTEGWWYAHRISRDWSSLAVRDVAVRFAGEPSVLVSGMKIVDKALDHPASAVREGKPLAFAGVDSLYFASALIPTASGAAVPALSEVRPLAVGDLPVAARKKLVDVTPRLVSRELSIAADRPVVHRYEIFAGPKQPDLLRAFGGPDGRMDDLVYYGWFGWVARPMVAVLHVLHAIVRNYGLAIILLTIMVRGAMFPLSRRQALSSQKMQALQPEMKALSEKYKNDPEKRTRATQELWRKHGVNPVGGCLPVFIQIPIFMGLYRALATDVELRQAPLISSAIRWCSNLAAPDMLLDWSRWMPSFLVAPEGWLGPFLNVFPLVTIGLFLWQQKLFMPPAMDEQQRIQQQVMNSMMWFMGVLFFKVPCGLCLYFIASSMWGIAERLLLPLPKPAGGVAPVAVTPGGNGALGRVIDAVIPAETRSRDAADAADAARRRRLARKKR